MYNVDGTMNQGGSITHETTMMMSHKGHQEKMFFVPKPETTAKRMCTDYQCLNKKTIKKNDYPLLLISEMIDKIRDAKVFTKLDLQWGFNNVWIKEGDEWKAAFTCHEGAFEPLVMYFGLTNSLSTLQTMMNALFFDMGACVMVYMDNILIYMKTEDGHDKIVLQVLEILWKNDLFVKAEKCKFKVRTVKFLGLIIGPNDVSIN